MYNIQLLPLVRSKQEFVVCGYLTGYLNSKKKFLTSSSQRILPISGQILHFRVPATLKFQVPAQLNLYAPTLEIPKKGRKISLSLSLTHARTHAPAPSVSET